MKSHLVTTKNLLLLCLVLLIAWSVYPHLVMPTTTMLIGDEAFVLDVAKSAATRERGLGGREALEQNTGMLFVFDSSSYHSFWMKGMRFPVDIAWLDDEWCVVHLVSNVSPETYPETFAPSRPARYVIELAAGVLETQKVSVGGCFEAPQI